MNDFTFTKLADLASERLGGRVLAASDEFFAPAKNLLKPAPPVFIPGKFTACGKWMDGWETRRRRMPGRDWCIVRLGLPGIVRGVVLDTSHFKGNFPAECSLDACGAESATPWRKLVAPGVAWQELFPRAVLQGDTVNSFAISHPSRFTHLRLNIFPDGGVARFRVYGEVVPATFALAQQKLDLAAIVNGGRVLAASDEFFGAPQNMLMPGAAANMGEGWETRRRRGPGHDWAVIQLGIPGSISRVEVDTKHFKGNFPESCVLEGCRASNAKIARDPHAAGITWAEILPRVPLRADHKHAFQREVRETGEVSHVRIDIFPDGGISRLRIFGAPSRDALRERGLARLNSLDGGAAENLLVNCCGSAAWVRAMTAQRPLANVDQLFQAADRIWASLTPEDWLESFRHHPPIGGRTAKEQQSPAARRWSAGEQSAIRRTPRAQRAALAAANRAYQERFGYIFIVCAAGKSGEEMLRILRQRLHHDPAEELRVAAGEQRLITRLRLEKLLESEIP